MSAAHSTFGAAAVLHACAVGRGVVKLEGAAGAVNAVVPAEIIVSVRQPVGSVANVTAAFVDRGTSVKKAICQSGGATLSKRGTW